MSPLLNFGSAITHAQQYVGATAPNPPVGAVAFDSAGEILAIEAHTQAGTLHAEAKVITSLREKRLLARAETLFITLEPCNHHGRTPPCTEAILSSGIQNIVYGIADPNPRVTGHGAQRLRDAGRQTRALDPTNPQEAPLREACAELIRPFAHWAQSGRPWIVVKTAHTFGGPRLGSMIPAPGQKTFTSEASLNLAHELRRHADAIITGVGTVIADRPEFTVRRMADHAIVSNRQKPRKLVVFDRERRTPPAWLDSARDRGFEVWLRNDIASTLDELAKAGVIEALVEAGPELSSAFLQSSLWNRHVLITQGNPLGASLSCPDSVQIIDRK